MFSAVLTGSSARLRRAGADNDTIAALRWCRSAVLLSLKGAATAGPIIASSAALQDYLRFDMASATTERFRVLYLNAQNELLMDEQTGSGTVDAAPFYPREIIGRAIELGATSLIVVHNHPSGDPGPSREDVECTRALESLCDGLRIALLDHLIVGRSDVVSFRAAGLLGS